MSENLKKILSDQQKDFPQEKLLDYINDQLTEQEQHALETQLNEDDFMSDALDGLQQFDANSDVSSLVNQLNGGLKKQLKKSKQKRKRRSLQIHDFPFYYTIIVFLLLIIISYLVINNLWLHK